MIGAVRSRSQFDAFRRAPSGRSGSVRVRRLDALEEGCLVAFALSRKVGNAVTRNRIRRRLRAVLVELDRMGSCLRPGSAYLLSAGADAATIPFAELRVAVAEAVRRSHDPSRRVRS